MKARRTAQVEARDKAPSSPGASSLEKLNRTITACRRCPRLVTWCRNVAETRRAAFRHETYWGKPIPGFGDPAAALLVVGLAPAAHGANRTGRMFTGDRSGEWLYRALHRAGFASQPESNSRDDGLTLSGAYITAVVRCAPPANKPTPEERDRCIGYLRQELELLTQVRTVVCLGKFAWDGVSRLLKENGHAPEKPGGSFGHGAECIVGRYRLLGSYHPSQQNTFTGRLTEPMLDAVFTRARELGR